MVVYLPRVVFVLSGLFFFFCPGVQRVQLKHKLDIIRSRAYRLEAQISSTRALDPSVPERQPPEEICSEVMLSQ